MGFLNCFMWGVQDVEILPANQDRNLLQAGCQIQNGWKSPGNQVSRFAHAKKNCDCRATIDQSARISRLFRIGNIFQSG
jgi:hypothetical protein